MSLDMDDTLMEHLRSDPSDSLAARAADEIAQLKQALAKSIERELELEKELDEARTCSRDLWNEWIDEYMKDSDGGSLLTSYPWLDYS